MESDLRVCNVRPIPNRPCCFEFATPTKRHLLQADSESQCNEWINALQWSIELAIRKKETEPMESKTSTQKSRKKSVIDELGDVAGNDRCADCSSPYPKWTSVNLGVAICINCSGIHRSLGVQVSKVRSLTLDVWEGETLELMRALGNEVVNGAYLPHYTEILSPPPAQPNSSRPEREAWIRAKYVEKAFARPAPQHFVTQSRRSSRISQTLVVEPPTVEGGLRLLEGAAMGDVSEMCRALARGADINSVIDPDGKGCRSALHQAIASGSIVASEFLLLNGAIPNLVDAALQTPLHVAVICGRTRNGLLSSFIVTVLICRQVCQLLKRKAVLDMRNREGATPLDLALQRTHPNIVTLLRLAKLKEDSSEDVDLEEIMIDMVDGAFNDCSQMAHYTTTNSDWTTLV